MQNRTTNSAFKSDAKAQYLKEKEHYNQMCGPVTNTSLNLSDYEKNLLEKGISLDSILAARANEEAKELV